MCSICNVYIDQGTYTFECAAAGLVCGEDVDTSWQLMIEKLFSCTIQFCLFSFFLFTFGVKLKHNFLYNNLAACKRAKLEKHAGWHMNINMHFAAICPICSSNSLYHKKQTKLHLGVFLRKQYTNTILLPLVLIKPLCVTHE